MPTDESYLDNLLKGLTSDAGEKEEDRLSSYRRRRDGEIRDSYERQDIPGFLNDYIEEDKKLQFHVVPEEYADDLDFEEDSSDFSGESGYFDDLDDQDSEDLGQDADDTIENYNIFEDDLDDSLIDEMIANELSEEYNPGKPFGVSETESAESEIGEENTDFEETFTESSDANMAPTANEVQDDRMKPQQTADDAEEFYDATQDLAGNLAEDTVVSDDTAAVAEDTGNDEADAFADMFGNMAEAAEEDNSNVTIISNGDEVSMIDTESLDALLADEDADDSSHVEFVDAGDSAAPAPSEEAASAEDEWVVDNSIEELPVETEGEGDLADIFSGGTESETPHSLNDIQGLEGLSSEDISSLDGLFTELEDETEENKAKADAKKEKIPFFLKLFGNVPIPPEKIKPEPSEEEIAAKKAEAAEKKKAQKEEKKKAADEKKKAAAEAKAAKAKQTAEEKAEAKAKKREQMEKMLLEDTGNTQKLNLAGCIVIFAMFAAIAALIISGINTANYNASIKEAEKDFNQALTEKNPDLYTEAYNQLLGLKLKDKDKILQDKVYTVNFVNVEITSFNNHYALGDKTRALRDLLQGVMIYNFYIDHAYELEIEDHLLYLRSILIGLLESEYGISEDEAVKVIHDYDDMESKLGELPANRYLTTYIFDKVKEVGNKQ